MSYNVFENIIIYFSFMKLFYIWVYTLFLVIVWWFFIVAKIHAYKFKNFSNYIEKVTKILLITLLIFSVLWYLVIIFLWKQSFKRQLESLLPKQ